MAVFNVSYEIPPGNHLSCISCEEVFATVTDAIEHTVVCRRKNRLTTKYEGKKDLDKIRGSVKWSRTNIAHLLDILKKRAADLGKAKAHYRTCELGKLHDEIARDLAKILGPGITRYQVTRKWHYMQRSSLLHERLRKKLLKEGVTPPDPPPFHPSIMEIMRCIQEEKVKFLKEMENSDGNFTLKLREEELEVPEELCIAKDDTFEFSEVTGDDANNESQGECSVGRNMVLKRSSVLSILNQLEEGVNHEQIIKEFDITEPVLLAIEQNGEAIAQGAQRCSLCHILFSTQDDVVAHEIECSRTYQDLQQGNRLTPDKKDGSEDLKPETVQLMVEVVLKKYPKYTGCIDWDYIVTQLSVLQSGVTSSQCSLKWQSLVSKCRWYQRLDDWCKQNNRSHSVLPPDFFDVLIPHSKSMLKMDPSKECIENFLSLGPSSTSSMDLKTGNEDQEKECEEREASPIWSEDDGNLNSNIAEEFSGSDLLLANLNGIEVDANESDDLAPTDQMEQDPETPSTKAASSEEELKPPSVFEHRPKKYKRLRRQKSEGKGTPESGGNQAHRIQQIETKLDDILGLLDDVIKENQRLTKEAEIKQSRDTHPDIADKLEKLTQVFVTAHNQNMKHLQVMTKMWERHHEEHQATMRSLIAEMGKRKHHNNGEIEKS